MVMLGIFVIFVLLICAVLHFEKRFNDMEENMNKMKDEILNELKELYYVCR